MIKKIIFLMVISVPAFADTGIAWTPETLKFVKHGNADKGKQLALDCSGCHGENGISEMPETPSLAGQLATYTYKQLRDYAKDNRSNAIMTSIASGLSEQDSVDLAAWFNSLKPSGGSAGKFSEKAKKMVEEGDGKRILPPCFVCHGEKGEKMDIPALYGQRADYLSKTLLEYKTGQRHNDVYSRMRLIAHQLSETEINDLAKYYQGK